MPIEIPKVHYDELTFSPDEVATIGRKQTGNFETATVDLGPDPDGETPIVFTIIRFAPNRIDDDYFHRPAIFFVHGMTDYFFHGHIAEFLDQNGFAVYGVDLRKCGRSWRPGQTWHHTTNQAYYDVELTTTLKLLTEKHSLVFAEGHSTGGLDVATWSVRLNSWGKKSREARELHQKLGGVVLNSPWLDLQFDPATRFIISNVFPAVSLLAPSLELPGGINPVYGQSLHSSESGRWDYSLELKPLEPRKKYISWLVGVNEQIKKIKRTPSDNGVPTLLLCSLTHDFSGKLSNSSYHADLILKPEQMRRWIGNIAPGADVVSIDGALHDVFLSEPAPLKVAQTALLRWLTKLEN